MKRPIQFLAAYEIASGAASLIAVAVTVQPSMLVGWGYVNAGILVLMCLASTVAGVRLWRNPASAGARELSLAVLGAQIPRAVLPGFAWSMTVGLNAFVGLLGGGINLTLNAMAFALVRLGHHDAQFELGINFVPLLLVIALRRWTTQPASTSVEPTMATG